VLPQVGPKYRCFVDLANSGTTRFCDILRRIPQDASRRAINSFLQQEYHANDASRNEAGCVMHR
jgi:hypothetical protein